MALSRLNTFSCPSCAVCLKRHCPPGEESYPRRQNGRDILACIAPGLSALLKIGRPEKRTRQGGQLLPVIAEHFPYNEHHLFERFLTRGYQALVD